MSRLEVICGCWGAPPKEYPEDLARCEYCYGGTSGEVIIDVPDDIYRDVMFGEMIVEELVQQGYLSSTHPSCQKTGAKRFYASTTVG